MSHVNPQQDAARVEIDSLTVSIGAQRLLAPVSVTVEPGRALAVRGDNGSGKTTLLRCVAGLQRPTGGTVRVDGEIVDERHRFVRARLAALLGAAPTYPDLTVYEHLLLIDASWGGRDDVEARIDEVLDDLGLGTLTDRFPQELSSGQRQLLHIALVLFRPASVLVLDEPEQRLDAERRHLVGQVLRRRVDQGATMLVATHDADLAAALADDEVVLVAADRA